MQAEILTRFIIEKSLGRIPNKFNWKQKLRLHLSLKNLMEESQISLIASGNFDYIYIEKAHGRIPNIHGKFGVEKLSLSFFCKVIPNDYLDHMVTLLKKKN